MLSVARRNALACAFIVLFVLLLTVAAQNRPDAVAQGKDGAANAQPGGVARPEPAAIVRAVGKNPREYRFDPPVVVINVGETVEWKDETGNDHTVTRNDAPSFNNDLDANKTTRITFTQASSGQGFDYFCVPHPTMTGKVIVRLPGSNKKRPEVELQERLMKLKPNKGERE